MGLGWAKPGVKCICVDVSGFLCHLDWPVPVKGVIYVIEALHPDDGSLLLQGLSVHGDNWFSGWRFRPLITLEDDISMFTALTNMSPIERLDRMKEMMDQ